jgi:hypothetical protein
VRRQISPLASLVSLMTLLAVLVALLVASPAAASGGAARPTPKPSHGNPHATPTPTPTPPPAATYTADGCLIVQSDGTFFWNRVTWANANPPVQVLRYALYSGTPEAPVFVGGQSQGFSEPYATQQGSGSYVLTTDPSLWTETNGYVVGTSWDDVAFGTVIFTDYVDTAPVTVRFDRPAGGWPVNPSCPPWP